jgi:hypothetical protein
MIEHGLMVNASYLILLEKLQDNTFLEEIGIHFSKHEMQWLLNNQYSLEIMTNYHVYHDCGKPYCRILDENGKQSFPNHAEISKEIHAIYFDDNLVNNLIAMDMNFHILKGDGLSNWLLEYKEKPMVLASLYVTAWSELLANSKMFGGYDSDSFKIKKKHLIKAGKSLFKQINI